MSPTTRITSKFQLHTLIELLTLTRGVIKVLTGTQRRRWRGLPQILT